ncbi:2-oxo acid dehydrogenase subunit E2 [Streptomyces sp. NPDC007984]|uniref:2-oxo acid dehydrogenase subunit E2 n=1 Tax=Streptomyces sp. NPDC007984 TaxID=3364801 RepID=UPI0036EBB615
MLNATVDADRQEIVRLPSVHLGFAPQTERGLVLPVIRNAGRRKLPELSAEIGRLTAPRPGGDADRGDLHPEQLRGLRCRRFDTRAARGFLRHIADLVEQPARLLRLL